MAWSALGEGGRGEGGPLDYDAPRLHFFPARPLEPLQKKNIDRGTQPLGNTTTTRNMHWRAHPPSLPLFFILMCPWASQSKSTQKKKNQRESFILLALRLRLFSFGSLTPSSPSLPLPPRHGAFRAGGQHTHTYTHTHAHTHTHKTAAATTKKKKKESEARRW